MRMRALVFVALLASCSSKPGASFTPSGDDAPDAVATTDVAAEASSPDAPVADVPVVDAPVRDGSVVDAPDVGSCGARPLPSRTGNPIVMGTTSGASALVGTCGGDESGEAAFSWTAPRGGTYVFHTGGSSYDTVLYVRDGSCGGRELGCNDDGKKSIQSEVRVTVRAGQTLVIVVDGFSGDDGLFELSITEDGSVRDAGAPDA